MSSTWERTRGEDARYESCVMSLVDSWECWIDGWISAPTAVCMDHFSEHLGQKGLEGRTTGSI